MKDFSKQIAVTIQSYCEFFFQVVHTAMDKHRYHISYLDSKGAKQFFTMEEQASGSWKIVNGPKVPDQIFNIEKLLETAIIENLAG